MKRRKRPSERIQYEHPFDKPPEEFTDGEIASWLSQFKTWTYDDLELVGLQHIVAVAKEIAKRNEVEVSEVMLYLNMISGQSEPPVDRECS